MIKKRVILWGSILLLLVGATLLSNYMNKQKMKVERGSFFPNFNSQDVFSISITKGDSSVTLVNNGTWEVKDNKSGNFYPADSVKVKSLFDKYKYMKKDQLVSRNKSNFDNLGVTKEKGIYAILKDKSGKIINAIIIGNKSKNWRQSNVRVEGSNTTYLVSGSIRFAFNYTLNEWRDRYIFHHDKDSISRVVIMDKIVLEKINDVGSSYWIVKKDSLEKRANEENVNEFLTRLSNYTCSDWADETIPYEDWVIQDGKINTKITLLNGNEETITLGKQDPTGRDRYYIKNSTRKDLFWVVGSSVETPFTSYGFLTYEPKPVNDTVANIGGEE